MEEYSDSTTSSATQSKDSQDWCSSEESSETETAEDKSYSMTSEDKSSLEVDEDKSDSSENAIFQNGDKSYPNYDNSSSDDNGGTAYSSLCRLISNDTDNSSSVDEDKSYPIDNDDKSYSNDIYEKARSSLFRRQEEVDDNLSADNNDYTVLPVDKSSEIIEKSPASTKYEQSDLSDKFSQLLQIVEQNSHNIHQLSQQVHGLISNSGSSSVRSRLSRKFKNSRKSSSTRSLATVQESSSSKDKSSDKKN